MKSKSPSPERTAHLKKLVHKRMANYYEDIQKIRDEEKDVGNSTNEQLNKIYSPDRTSSLVDRKYNPQNHRIKKQQYLAQCMDKESKEIKDFFELPDQIADIKTFRSESPPHKKTTVINKSRLQRSPKPEHYAAKFDENVAETGMNIEEDIDSFDSQLDEQDQNLNLLYINTQKRYKFDGMGDIKKKEEYKDFDFHQRKSKEIRRLQYGAYVGDYGTDGRLKKVPVIIEHVTKAKPQPVSDDSEEIEVEVASSDSEEPEEYKVYQFDMKRGGKQIPYRAEFKRGKRDDTEPFADGNEIKLWPMKTGEKVCWGKVVPLNSLERDIGIDAVVLTPKGDRILIQFEEEEPSPIVNLVDEGEVGGPKIKAEDIKPSDKPDPKITSDEKPEPLNNKENISDFEKRREVSNKNCRVFDERDRHLGDGRYCLVDEAGKEQQYMRGVYVDGDNDPEWCVLGITKGEPISKGFELRKGKNLEKKPEVSQEEVMRMAPSCLTDGSYPLDYIKLKPVEGTSALRYLFLVPEHAMKRPEKVIKDKEAFTVCEDCNDYKGPTSEEDENSFRTLISNRGDFVIIEPFEEDPEYHLELLKKIYDSVKRRRRPIMTDTTNTDRQEEMDIFFRPHISGRTAPNAASDVSNYDMPVNNSSQEKETALEGKDKIPSKLIYSKVPRSTTKTNPHSHLDIRDKPKFRDRNMPMISKNPRSKSNMRQQNCGMPEATQQLKPEIALKKVNQTPGRTSIVETRSPKKKRIRDIPSRDLPECSEREIDGKKDKASKVNSRIKDGAEYTPTRSSKLETENGIRRMPKSTRTEKGDLCRSQNTPSKRKPAMHDQRAIPGPFEQGITPRAAMKKDSKDIITPYKIPVTQQHQALKKDSGLFKVPKEKIMKFKSPFRNSKKGKPKMKASTYSPTNEESKIGKLESQEAEGKTHLQEPIPEMTKQTSLQEGIPLQRIAGSSSGFKTPSRPLKKSRMAPEKDDETPTREEAQIQKVSKHRQELAPQPSLKLSHGNSDLSPISKSAQRLTVLDSQKSMKFNSPTKLRKKAKPPKYVNTEQTQKEEGGIATPTKLDYKDSINTMRYQEIPQESQVSEAKEVPKRANFKSKSIRFQTPTKTHKKKSLKEQERVDGPTSKQDEGSKMSTALPSDRNSAWSGPARVEEGHGRSTANQGPRRLRGMPKKDSKRNVTPNKKFGKAKNHQEEVETAQDPEELEEMVKGLDPIQKSNNLNRQSTYDMPESKEASKTARVLESLQNPRDPRESSPTKASKKKRMDNSHMAEERPQGQESKMNPSSKMNPDLDTVNKQKQDDGIAFQSVQSVQARRNNLRSNKRFRDASPNASRRKIKPKNEEEEQEAARQMERESKKQNKDAEDFVNRKKAFEVLEAKEASQADRRLTNTSKIARNSSPSKVTRKSKPGMEEQEERPLETEEAFGGVEKTRQVPENSRRLQPIQEQERQVSQVESRRAIGLDKLLGSERYHSPARVPRKKKPGMSEEKESPKTLEGQITRPTKTSVNDSPTSKRLIGTLSQDTSRRQVPPLGEISRRNTSPQKVTKKSKPGMDEKDEEPLPTESAIGMPGKTSANQSPEARRSFTPIKQGEVQTVEPKIFEKFDRKRSQSRPTQKAKKSKRRGIAEQKEEPARRQGAMMQPNDITRSGISDSRRVVRLPVDENGGLQPREQMTQEGKISNFERSRTSKSPKKIPRKTKPRMNETPDSPKFKQGEREEIEKTSKSNMQKIDPSTAQQQFKVEENLPEESTIKNLRLPERSMSPKKDPRKNKISVRDNADQPDLKRNSDIGNPKDIKKSNLPHDHTLSEIDLSSIQRPSLQEEETAITNLRPPTRSQSPQKLKRKPRSGQREQEDRPTQPEYNSSRPSKPVKDQKPKVGSQIREEDETLQNLQQDSSRREDLPLRQLADARRSVSPKKNVKKRKVDQHVDQDSPMEQYGDRILPKGVQKTGQSQASRVQPEDLHVLQKESLQEQKPLPRSLRSPGRNHSPSKVTKKSKQPQSSVQDKPKQTEVNSSRPQDVRKSEMSESRRVERLDLDKDGILESGLLREEEPIESIRNTRTSQSPQKPTRKSKPGMSEEEDLPKDLEGNDRSPDVRKTDPSVQRALDQIHKEGLRRGSLLGEEKTLKSLGKPRESKSPAKVSRKTKPRMAEEMDQPKGVEDQSNDPERVKQTGRSNAQALDQVRPEGLSRREVQEGDRPLSNLKAPRSSQSPKKSPRKQGKQSEEMDQPKQTQQRNAGPNDPNLANMSESRRARQGPIEKLEPGTVHEEDQTIKNFRKPMRNQSPKKDSSKRKPRGMEEERDAPLGQEGDNKNPQEVLKTNKSSARRAEHPKLDKMSQREVEVENSTLQNLQKPRQSQSPVRASKKRKPPTGNHRDSPTTDKDTDKGPSEINKTDKNSPGEYSRRQMAPLRPRDSASPGRKLANLQAPRRNRSPQKDPRKSRTSQRREQEDTPVQSESYNPRPKDVAKTNRNGPGGVNREQEHSPLKQNESKQPVDPVQNWELPRKRNQSPSQASKKTKPSMHHERDQPYERETQTSRPGEVQEKDYKDAASPEKDVYQLENDEARQPDSRMQNLESPRQSRSPERPSKKTKPSMRERPDEPKFVEGSRNKKGVQKSKRSDQSPAIQRTPVLRKNSLKNRDKILKGLKGQNSTRSPPRSSKKQKPDNESETEQERQPSQSRFQTGKSKKESNQVQVPFNLGQESPTQKANRRSDKKIVFNSNQNPSRKERSQPKRRKDEEGDEQPSIQDVKPVFKKKKKEKKNAPNKSTASRRRPKAQRNKYSKDSALKKQPTSSPAPKSKLTRANRSRDVNRSPSKDNRFPPGSNPDRLEQTPQPGIMGDFNARKFNKLPIHCVRPSHQNGERMEERSVKKTPKKFQGLNFAIITQNRKIEMRAVGSSKKSKSPGGLNIIRPFTDSISPRPSRGKLSSARERGRARDMIFSPGISVPMSPNVRSGAHTPSITSPLRRRGASGRQTPGSIVRRTIIKDTVKETRTIRNSQRKGSSRGTPLKGSPSSGSLRGQNSSPGSAANKRLQALRKIEKNAARCIQRFWRNCKDKKADAKKREYNPIKNSINNSQSRLKIPSTKRKPVPRNRSNKELKVISRKQSDQKLGKVNRMGTLKKPAIKVTTGKQQYNPGTLSKKQLLTDLINDTSSPNSPTQIKINNNNREAARKQQTAADRGRLGSEDSHLQANQIFDSFNFNDDGAGDLRQVADDIISSGGIGYSQRVDDLPGDREYFGQFTNTQDLADGFKAKSSKNKSGGNRSSRGRQESIKNMDSLKPPSIRKPPKRSSKYDTIKKTMQPSTYKKFITFVKTLPPNVDKNKALRLFRSSQSEMLPG